MLWVRWIMECLGSMASISIAFATHGPGMMPDEEVDNLEVQYLQYRDAYNSFLGSIFFNAHDGFGCSTPGYIELCLVKFHKTVKLHPLCFLEPWNSFKAWHFGRWKFVSYDSQFDQRCIPLSIWNLSYGQRMVHHTQTEFNISTCFLPVPISFQRLWTGLIRILDFVPRHGNARYYQCLLDEDMIRREPFSINLVICIFLHPWGRYSSQK